MHEKGFVIKVYSKSQLAGHYGCDVRTLMAWLHPWQEELALLGYQTNQRMFTPRQVQIIISRLGEP